MQQKEQEQYEIEEEIDRIIILHEQKSNRMEAKATKKLNSLRDEQDKLVTHFQEAVDTATRWVLLSKFNCFQ